jgi:hypothetical protein
MSAFWQGMTAANDLAIETMGESLRVGDVEVMGVVDGKTWQEGAAPGGRKTIVRCEVLLSATVEVRDGMPVHVRGADGKVDGWDTIGPDGHRMVRVGPFNRWSGEIPGV